MTSTDNQQEPNFIFFLGLNSEEMLNKWIIFSQK